MEKGLTPYLVNSSLDGRQPLPTAGESPLMLQRCRSLPDTDTQPFKMQKIVQTPIRAFADVLPLILAVVKPHMMLKSLEDVGEDLRLLKDAKISLAFCKDQLLVNALFCEFEQVLTVTSWFARIAAVSKEFQHFSNNNISPTSRKRTADSFLLMCRQLTATTMNPYDVNKLLQLRDKMLGDSIMHHVSRYARQGSPTCFLSKEMLIEKLTHSLCGSFFLCGMKEKQYEMTTVADVRFLALVWDAMVEEGKAGTDSLESTNQGMTCGAAMLLVPRRTAAVNAAVRASGCMQIE
jgi:hypothetical protein